MKQVGIIMGSKSDLPVMQDAIDILKDFEIDCEVKIISAHRTPDKMFEYARNAKKIRYANSTEISEKCKDPVIDLMTTQKEIQNTTMMRVQ